MNTTFNGSSGDYDEDWHVTEGQLATAAITYCVPIIVLLGTVGNVLSFAVLLRQSMRSTPMYFYLTLLAVVDTLVLYTSAFRTWIRLMTGWDALHTSNVSCKVLMYVLLNSLYLSAWLIVLVTLDRFIVVWFPFRANFIRIKHARWVALGLSLFVALYNVHVFWTFGLYVGSDGLLTCDAYSSYFMEHVFEYLRLASYSIVPFMLVITLNASILVRLRQSSRLLRFTSGTGTAGTPSKAAGNKRNAMHSDRPTAIAGEDGRSSASSTDQEMSTNRRKKQVAVSKLIKSKKELNCITTTTTGKSGTETRCVVVDGSSRQQRMTRMLLFVSFAWLVLTAPYALHILGANSKQGGSRRSPSFFKAICFLLDYVNHASNFYLYCVTGKKFRRELRAMIFDAVSHLTGIDAFGHDRKRKLRRFQGRPATVTKMAPQCLVEGTDNECGDVALRKDERQPLPLPVVAIHSAEGGTIHQDALHDSIEAVEELPLVELSPPAAERG